ncbi:uncharacterized protein LOC128126777 [Lactuca sativa]|uniref:uncharacterized protein LOC128126777 n=1 Tax=Lactuca sativa TaxID=4236 RepID=UPI0022AF3DF5|nr:uncharacterized protein LOC128126777 [Lactuca sativa]
MFFPVIAKGVRFNVEKKQVGNYYSTKIWSFTMKAPCCKHVIVIQTNPKNCQYLFISGAQKKVEEFEPEDAETMVLQVEEVLSKYAMRIMEKEIENHDVCQHENRKRYNSNYYAREKENKMRKIANDEGTSQFTTQLTDNALETVQVATISAAQKTSTYNKEYYQ